MSFFYVLGNGLGAFSIPRVHPSEEVALTTGNSVSVDGAGMLVDDCYEFYVADSEAEASAYVGDVLRWEKVSRPFWVLLDREPKAKKTVGATITINNDAYLSSVFDCVTTRGPRVRQRCASQLSHSVVEWNGSPVEGVANTEAMGEAIDEVYRYAYSRWLEGDTWLVRTNFDIYRPVKAFHRLNCVAGEADGDVLLLSPEDIPLTSDYLRAAFEWEVLSKTGQVEHRPDFPPIVELARTQHAMMDAGIFRNKWQARSDWVLEAV